MISYALPGSRRYQERLYPNPTKLQPDTAARSWETYEDVIAHFTLSSRWPQDGIRDLSRRGRSSVAREAGAAGYIVSFQPLPAHLADAARRAVCGDPRRNALRRSISAWRFAGAEALSRSTPAWNPMAGYPVNTNERRPSEWLPCLPLGMPMVNHQAVTLMHYPPIVAYQHGGLSATT